VEERMKTGFKDADGKVIVENLIKTIHENRAYLSEIDGAIGDGDHGINMDKGFSKAEAALEGQDVGMSAAMLTLGKILVEDIGGSMGPLYGTFFRRMARVSRDTQIIDATVVIEMLEAAFEGVQSIGDAKVGDKTLLDTLSPAVTAFKRSVEEGKSFSESIDTMIAAADAGKVSTIDMVAKVGRASRLGERSRGVLDPGATSCFLLLRSMGRTMQELLA
jgi:dihydroxyacetone kinase-like protein